MTAEDFSFIVKNGKRSNKINGVTFDLLINYSYNFVKIELPELLRKGDIGNIVVYALKEKGEKNVKLPPFKECLSFVLWLKDELESVYKLESQYLVSPPDADLVNAGIRDLDELGELNLIDSLAGGDILKWEAVKKLPYHMVFDKQRKTVIEAKINKRLSEIKNRPNKR